MIGFVWFMFGVSCLGFYVWGLGVVGVLIVVCWV